MKFLKFLLLTFSIPFVFTQDIFLQLTNLDSTGGNYSVDIQVYSSVEIAGFQFQITGGILDNGMGGVASDNLSTITTNPNGMVLAFDFLGNVIPAEDGVLINLTFSELTDSEICIENPIFTSIDSEVFYTDSGACLSTGQENSAPSVNILEPENGAVLYNNTIAVNLLNVDPNNIGFHYHLELDGENIGMFYENYFTLENLSWGDHSLTVVLADPNHAECEEPSCSQTVNFTLIEPSPETIDISIVDVDPISRTFMIYTNNSGTFNSFDFDINGVEIEEIMSENLEMYEFAYSIANNSINGVSITNSFPAGESNFMTIYYTNPSDNEICINNPVFINANNIEMITSTQCADIILPENEYYLTDLAQTGVSQLIHFSSGIEGLQPGDEIGIFDQSGISEEGADCDNLTTSEVLVGSGLMLYDDISIYATGSVDMCSFGGFITPGFNLGNPIKIKVYRPSEMMEYETENLTFSNGSGTFTELFTEVTSLSLVNEITNSAPTAVIDQLEVETYRNTNITLDGSSSVDSDGNITSYEWYLNGEDLIGSNQSLTHQFSTLGDYMITLVVTDNESAIGSSVSVASVINQLPTEVSLLSPNNAEIVNIDDFENGTINFSWTESIDLDNDNLTYTINLWKTDMPEEHNVEIELMDTSYLTAFNSEFLDLEIDMDQNYSWNITVSDGFDEVSSSTNTFELSFVMDSNTEYNPNQYSLSQNYPNPFNPNTEIQYSLNRAELVTLDIYNIAGKYIVQLINEKQNAGVHSINWNATDQNGISVPAGLYIFKLNSQSNGSIQKTMTLLK